jgi:hypothetical protein
VEQEWQFTDWRSRATYHLALPPVSLGQQLLPLCLALLARASPLLASLEQQLLWYQAQQLLGQELSQAELCRAV